MILKSLSIELLRISAIRSDSESNPNMAALLVNRGDFSLIDIFLYRYKRLVTNLQLIVKTKIRIVDINNTALEKAKIEMKYINVLPRRKVRIVEPIDFP